MAEFPRTQIESLSVPRLIPGTNWWLGFSHTTRARSKLIMEMQTRERLADILTVFLEAGIDALYGSHPAAPNGLPEAIKDAEDRAGRRITKICIPTFDTSDTSEARDKNLRVMDDFAEFGCDVLMPHGGTTDVLVDRRSRTIRQMEFLIPEIRARGMIPGLSTHMPEVPVYADEMGLDVGTYIQIYNARGFLMQIEVDWVQRMIWGRKKPVITIKPLAAGRLHPLVGLAFSFATLREIDMVCAGTLTADEARETIEIASSILEHRAPRVDLQETRSKASVKDKA